MRRKLLKNLLFLVSVLALLLLLLITMITPLGYRPCVVTSKSMQPLYPKTSIVLVSTRKSYRDANIGDVIVYRSASNDLIMHRLVGENTLKGDANHTSEHVGLNGTNFIGVASAIAIPNLGNLASAVASKPWIPWCFVLILAVIICIPLGHQSKEP